MGLLKGKRALVTGGTSGLGRAIAETFAKEGADVAIVGKNFERGAKVLTSLNELKEREEQAFCFITLDVTDKEEVDRAVDNLLKRWAKVEILVNCAGMTKDNLFMRMKEEDWDQVIATNLKSVYNLTHALVRPMIKWRHGKVINVTSVIGLTGNPGQANYAASKMGIVGLTRSLAKELAPRCINVNCIAPGFFETPMTDLLTLEQREKILDRVPMKRLGDPKEIGFAALFLASHMSDYITGQVLTVDGGMIA